jgi:hypothetical protein
MTAGSAEVGHSYGGMVIKARVVEKPISSTQENAMQQFIDKYAAQLAGVLTGFDRLVFRGSLRRLNYGWWDANLNAVVAAGMEQYLWQNKILFKDYLPHVKRCSERLRNCCVKPFQDQGLPVRFDRSPSTDRTSWRVRWLRRETSARDWCVPSARWSRAPRLSTEERISFGGNGHAVWCINIRSIPRWDGCTRGFRRGFPSTFRWA